MLIAKQIETLKGIHPGVFLARELKKNQQSLEGLALATGLTPQSLKDILSGKRDLSKRMASKIEHALNINNGLLTALQFHYDNKKAREHHRPGTYINRPNIKKFRRALFWDTHIESIRWNEQKSAVIKRIFERGNDQEKQEIIRFYGTKTIEEILPQALTHS